MSSSVPKVSPDIPVLRRDTQPGINICYLDWEDLVLSFADGFCRQFCDTGATCLVASNLAWKADPRNVVDPNDDPLDYVARVQYPDPVRDPSDTTAVRVIHDRADKKREAFLVASSQLKDAIIASFGPELCEAAAAASPNGRLMLMSARDLFEWAESEFGVLTSTDVKELVATLSVPLLKASQFQTHQAAFVRNIRRMRRGQLRVAVGIMPNDHQLFSYLYESVYALPEFLQSLGMFSLQHPDIDSQTHVALSKFLLTQMPFMLGQSGSGKYAGSAQQAALTASPAQHVHPHTPNVPSAKGIARKAKAQRKAAKAAETMATQVAMQVEAIFAAHSVPYQPFGYIPRAHFVPSPPPPPHHPRRPAPPC